MIERCSVAQELGVTSIASSIPQAHSCHLHQNHNSLPVTSGFMRPGTSTCRLRVLKPPRVERSESEVGGRHEYARVFSSIAICSNVTLPLTSQQYPRNVTWTPRQRIIEEYFQIASDS